MRILETAVLLKILLVLIVLLGTVLLFTPRLAAAARTVSYKGWDGSVILSNRNVRLVLVPKVARVLGFSLKDRPNVLWEDPAAAGKLQNTDSEKTGDYVNFGGAKLWVAPQSKWGTLWSVWPPFYALDSGPCAARAVNAGTVLLEGLASETAGVRLDRKVSLTKDGASFVYRMTNVADKPVEWGLWMVANVKSGGRVFIPSAADSELWSNAKDKSYSESMGWKRTDGILSMDFKDGPDSTKLFSMAAGGWIAYIVEGQAFFITYSPDLKAVQPEGEAPTEIYRGKEFVELEHVGPLVRLSPGATTELREEWHILPAPGNRDAAGLTRWVADHGRKFAR